MRAFRIAACTIALIAAPRVALAVPRIGQPAPPMSLPTVDGRAFDLASLKGKPVYLNFFATWCGPCNDEAPEIGRLSDRYKARGLRVVGVDELENPQKAKEFFAKYHLTYAAVVDADGGAGKAYGALGLPVHVFINRAGVVTTYRLGEMSAGEIETAIKGIV